MRSRCSPSAESQVATNISVIVVGFHANKRRRPKKEKKKLFFFCLTNVCGRSQRSIPFSEREESGKKILQCAWCISFFCSPKTAGHLDLIGSQADSRLIDCHRHRPVVVALFCFCFPLCWYTFLIESPSGRRQQLLGCRNIIKSRASSLRSSLYIYCCCCFFFLASSYI